MQGMGEGRAENQQHSLMADAVLAPPDSLLSGLDEATFRGNQRCSGERESGSSSFTRHCEHIPGRDRKPSKVASPKPSSPKTCFIKT